MGYYGRVKINRSSTSLRSRCARTRCSRPSRSAVETDRARPIPRSSTRCARRPRVWAALLTAIREPVAVLRDAGERRRLQSAGVAASAGARRGAQRHRRRCSARSQTSSSVRGRRRHRHLLRRRRWNGRSRRASRPIATSWSRAGCAPSRSIRRSKEAASAPRPASISPSLPAGRPLETRVPEPPRLEASRHQTSGGAGAGPAEFPRPHGGDRQPRRPRGARRARGIRRSGGLDRCRTERFRLAQGKPA